jgi:hypothetical protein
MVNHEIYGQIEGVGEAKNNRSCAMKRCKEGKIYDYG